MAVPLTPTETQEFAGSLSQRAEVGYAGFSVQTIDLTTIDATTATIYDTRGLNRVSARIAVTTFGDATVELQGTVDGQIWTRIATLSSVTPEVVNQNIEGYPFIRFLTAIRDAAATAATVAVHAFAAENLTSDFFLELTNLPIVTEGGRKELVTHDDNAHQLLMGILQQLKITNLHLTKISDNQFSVSDAAHTEG